MAGRVHRRPRIPTRAVNVLARHRQHICHWSFVSGHSSVTLIATSPRLTDYRIPSTKIRTPNTYLPIPNHESQIPNPESPIPNTGIPNHEPPITNKMKTRLTILPAILAVLLILPGCKSSSSMMDQASGLLGMAGGIPEISQFMNLAQLGGLAGMLTGGNPFTLLAPSNEALEALGSDALARLQTPDGADELKGLLERHIVPGSVDAGDLGSALGDANVLKSEQGDDGFVHVIDKVLAGG